MLVIFTKSATFSGEATDLRAPRAVLARDDDHRFLFDRFLLLALGLGLLRLHPAKKLPIDELIDGAAHAASLSSMTAIQAFSPPAPID